MKKLVVLLLVLALSYAVEYDGECESFQPLTPRPHTISVLEFGAVGDGKTLNTLAFQNAIFYSKSFADKGGAQLYVPKGRWLIGSINLTSYMTLFLEKDAIILGSQEHSYLDIVELGRDIELHDRRYGSLITGNNLTDVVITGDNGTIDGQGSIWWEQFTAHSLNYSRPHLVEFIGSNNVIITNLTFLNAPAWNIHFAYCRKVLVQNVTIYSPPDAPYSSGIVPDSSEHVALRTATLAQVMMLLRLKVVGTSMELHMANRPQMYTFGGFLCILLPDQELLSAARFRVAYPIYFSSTFMCTTLLLALGLRQLEEGVAISKASTYQTCSWKMYSEESRQQVSANHIRMTDFIFMHCQWSVASPLRMWLV